MENPEEKDAKLIECLTARYQNDLGGNWIICRKKPDKFNSYLLDFCEKYEQVETLGSFGKPDTICLFIPKKKKGG